MSLYNINRLVPVLRERNRQDLIGDIRTLRVKIGDRSRILTGAYVSGNTVIEEDVFIGPMAVTANDLYMSMWRDKKYEAPVIKRRAAVGAGAKLPPGVTIGEGAVVGMGAVVVGDVPSGRVVAGNLARDIGPARGHPG